MASSSIWDLVARLGIDTSDFTKNIDGAVSKSHSAGSAIVGNLSKVGGAVVLGGLAAAGAGLVAVGGLLASTIGPASDLAETVSKTGIVFGDFSDSVLKMGKDAAASMGMSENAALSAASTYGNLFRSMGMNREVSADMSTGLVQLASDLASFNNIDPTEVMDKLRAGLTGESEPLKTLGVNINQAMIETKALSMGLIKNGDVMTAAQKATASYALIMEQTTLAQGDFARTSKGLANQQRIMAANFENIKSTIGTALLPLIGKISGAFNDWLSSPAVQEGIATFVTGLSNLAGIIGDILGDLVDGGIGVAFDDLREVLSGVVPPYVIDAMTFLYDAIEGFINLLKTNKGVVVAIFGTLGVAVAAFGVTSLIAMAPIILTFGLIGVAIYLLYQAWTNNFGGMRDYLTALWEGTLKPALSDLWDWLQIKVPQALAWLSDKWTTVLLPAIKTVWEWINGTLLPFLKGPFSTAINNAAGWISGTLTNAFNTVRNSINWVIQAVKDVISWIDKIPKVTIPAVTGAATTGGGVPKVTIPAVTGSAIPSWLKGRDAGGPVMAGQAYAIGKGPYVETFVPNVSGEIIPHGGSFGGSNNGEVIGLLRQIAGKKDFDTDGLARMLRDAVMQVAG